MRDRLPALTPREVIAVFERRGFYIARINGSHHILKHPTDPGIRLTIAVHRKEFKPSTLRRIIKDSGMNVDEFLSLL